MLGLKYIYVSNKVNTNWIIKFNPIIMQAIKAYNALLITSMSRHTAANIHDWSVKTLAWQGFFGADNGPYMLFRQRLSWKIVSCHLVIFTDNIFKCILYVFLLIFHSVSPKFSIGSLHWYFVSGMIHKCNFYQSLYSITLLNRFKFRNIQHFTDDIFKYILYGNFLIFQSISPNFVPDGKINISQHWFA